MDSKRQGKPIWAIGMGLLAITMALVACARASPNVPSAPAQPRVPSLAAPSPGEASKAAGEATKAAGVKLAKDFRVQPYQGLGAGAGDEFAFSRLFDGGKPVVLNFFAGLCPPCRAEMPDIQSVSLQYQGRVTIFGLDIGPFVGLGSRADGQALVRELGVRYPTGTTFDAEVVRVYQVLGMPTTLFMTPDGKVSRKWTGLLTRAKIAELIEELLKASGA